MGTFRQQSPDRGASHVSADIAVVACSFELQADGSIQLTPWGKFSARDGRPHSTDHWWIDERNADKVLAALRAHKDRIVIDYDHQTLYTEQNGQRAPAAGWFLGADVEARPGQGLFVVPDWTEAAKSAIEAKEYLYFSPVMKFNKRTGELLDILMGAITNYAAIDGMNDLHGVAAAKFLTTLPEDPSMEELLKLFGLKPDATEGDAIAALKALQGEIESLKQQVSDKDEQIAAAKAETPQSAMTAMKDLQQELAALKAQVEGDQMDTLIAAAMSDGKLIPAQEEWARGLGVDALKGYLENARAIAALKGEQTTGNDLDDDGDAELSQEAIATCKQLGVSPDDYKKTLEG